MQMALKAGRGSDQFMVRLPGGMRDQIREAAETAGRSMNAEIVARLEGHETVLEKLHETNEFLTRREMELFQDRVELRKLREDHETVRGQLQSQDSLIEELRNENADLSAHVAELRTRLEMKQAEVDQVRADLKEAQTRAVAPSSDTERDELNKLHEAINRLQVSVTEGRRHFEEVEKPVLAEALAMHRILRHIARDGADPETIELLRQFINEDSGSFERSISKLTGHPVSGALEKAVERLGESAPKAKAGS